MKNLDKYLGLSLVSLKQALVYRGSFFTSFLSQFVKTLVLIAVWLAVFQGRSQIAGFDYKTMLTYLIVSQAIHNIYGFMNEPNRVITRKIKTGTVSFDLLRPLSFTNARLAENMGQTLVQLFFSLITLVFFSLVFREFSAPFSLLHAAFAAISVILGYFIMFTILMTSGLLSFWFMNNWGTRNMVNAIIAFLSGALVPLSMLPQGLQSVINLLPFKNIVYVPTMIYMGRFGGQDALLQILFQLLWALALWLMAKVVFKLAIRRVSINGG